MAKKETTQTPLMKQYAQIKAKYQGALLLFRVGDFYETFGEDAIKASKILDIVLTKRANGSASHIELAGFPHHALDNYLPKLVRAGERVAICDQLEDPKFAQGIVKRGVTELVTPGLAYNDNVLDTKQNNFLASLYIPPHFMGDMTDFHTDKHCIGVSFLDLSTGEFSVAQGSWAYIEKLLQSLMPSEIIYSRENRNALQERLEKYNTNTLEDWIFSWQYAQEKMLKHFNTLTFKGFGIEEMKEGIMAAGAVLYYLELTEHNDIQHITKINRIDESEYVWLDKFTIRNLEILHTQNEAGITLSKVIDKTMTSMGGRMLRKWIAMPLRNLKKIQQRQKIVKNFVGNIDLIEETKSLLKEIGDIERLISKVAAKRINPRELLRLKKSLQQIPLLKTLLSACEEPEIQRIANSLDNCEDLANRIEKEVQEDAPLVINQGNLIKENIHEELDKLRQIAFSGKDYLDKIVEREIQRTGINSLKISFNKVFGYYIEVTNVHKNKVPADWIRKQTLVNGERFITEELKQYEETILSAEDKMSHIEQKIFIDLVLFACGFVQEIQHNAQVIAMLDSLVSFAQIAIEYQYVCPEVNDSTTIEIIEGRHPVIERNLPSDQHYVPNDVKLDQENQQIIIITGPNMAGKSAFLRQTALIVLMAQIGSFVPARSASIGFVDKIFTRVGASDNLAQGESTFMVEMTETASIMNNLSQRSLVIMDEIGRGTSTYDGISIAWAIVEYLHQEAPQSVIRPKVLFATHYHELNQLAEKHPRVKNYNVSVKEINGKVVFLRKLKEGGSEHSFGIHVAQMAGMPNQIVIRAQEIMQHFENSKIKDIESDKIRNIPKKALQNNLFEPVDIHYNRIKEMLIKLDINTISPVEALLKLNEMKNIVDTSKK